MIDISVIIPVYNVLKDGGEMLRQCVASVLSQQGVELEVVMVDDGSTDGSGRLCDELASDDNRIKVVHQQNRGLGGARNSGVSASSGRYVFFLDADDVVFEDCMRKLLVSSEAFDEDKAHIIIGEWTLKPISIRGRKPTVRLRDSRGYLRDTLFQTGGHATACAMLIDRKLMLLNPFTEGIWYEDLDWLPRIYLAVDSVVQTNVLCYYYRQHPGSFMHSWSDGRLDVLKVTEGIERYVADKAPELLPAARDRRLSASFNIFNLASIHGQTEVADRCWKVIKSYRYKSLFGRHTRLKNRIGVIASCFGAGFLARVMSKL